MRWDERLGRRLTLRDLRILLIAVEAGSVSKAAVQLRVSQPAISKTIAQIERALGARLVERGPRGIAATAAGEALVARVRMAFHHLRASVEAMDESVAPNVGELRLCGNQVALSELIPAIIAEIHATRPDIVFNVRQSHTFADQVRLLEDEEVELVVARVAMPMPMEKLRMEELFRDDFVVVARSANRWRRRKSIALDELLDEPWTFPPEDTVTGHAMAEIFRSNGLTAPRRGAAATSLQLHRRLVAESGFLTFFPASVANTLPGVAVLPVRLAQPPQVVGILTLKHRTASPLARLFIEGARRLIAAAAPARGA